jgi:5-methylcytosine-specific restriction endonuclease McrBC GTP-binding regulatory subunit McrB
MPVQATWRDKSNILGFFNEFSKTYTETDFLVELYRASYNPDRLQFFVLDEMNISRVEYYFADLLSVLEYPKEDWKLKVMQVPYNFIPPVKLEDGAVQIPPNSYFVGTANKDDSTFTITDKVYDRAITMEFSDRNKPFTVNEDVSTVKLSASKLQSLYDAALADEINRMNDADMAKLNAVCDYVYDQFGITIGNRILNQIDNIVPVFVAAGGAKETAIDYMISKKLVGKIEGRFEDYVKDALKGLIDLINKTYGPGVLSLTEKTARAIIKTL